MEKTVMLTTKFLSVDRLLSLCTTCLHKDLGMPTCTAYPFGIPKEFLAGKDKHEVSRGDDGGIVYTPLANISTSQ